MSELDDPRAAWQRVAEDCLREPLNCANCQQAEYSEGGAAMDGLIPYPQSQPVCPWHRDLLAADTLIAALTAQQERDVAIIALAADDLRWANDRNEMLERALEDVEALHAQSEYDYISYRLGDNGKRVRVVAPGCCVMCGPRFDNDHSYPCSTIRTVRTILAGATTDSPNERNHQ